MATKQKESGSSELVASAGTSMIPADKSPYPVIAHAEGVALLKSALIDSGVGLFNLTQLRVPTGGTPAWTVDGLGGPEVVKVVEGVIAAVRPGLKKWWRSGIGEGEKGPPDCVSLDGMIGRGVNSLDPSAKPGEHDCLSCNWNLFKSARNGGRGKDCGDYMAALFVRDGSLLPDVLNIPASSLKDFQTYCVKLANKMKTHERVVTRLGLVQRDGPGVKYCAIVPEYVRDLSPEESERFKDAGLVMKEYLHRAFATPRAPSAS